MPRQSEGAGGHPGVHGVGGGRRAAAGIHRNDVSAERVGAKAISAGVASVFNQQDAGTARADEAYGQVRDAGMINAQADLHGGDLLALGH